MLYLQWKWLANFLKFTRKLFDVVRFDFAPQIRFQPWARYKLFLLYCMYCIVGGGECTSTVWSAVQNWGKNHGSDQSSGAPASDAELEVEWREKDSCWDWHVETKQEGSRVSRHVLITLLVQYRFVNCVIIVTISTMRCTVVRSTVFQLYVVSL